MRRKLLNGKMTGIILALILCAGLTLPAFASESAVIANVTVSLPSDTGLAATFTDVFAEYYFSDFTDKKDQYSVDCNIIILFDESGTMSFNQEVSLDLSGVLDAGETIGVTMDYLEITADDGMIYAYYFILASLNPFEPSDEEELRQLSDLAAESPLLSATEEEEEPQPGSVTELIARPTASSVLVNGETVAFDAYNINDNNYFKLRDLAYVLNGSEKQFEVEFISENNTIMLIGESPYTVIGGEMTAKGSENKTPVPSRQSILFVENMQADAPVSPELTAYNIDGNNYFKLRDIGLLFDFGVEWDGENNTIVIDTSTGYTPE
ncbi:MAG: hypothetical protein FWG32_08520 [Oscillospiraceae bacterium]|nr:hypothetical protein [Oscillospiraceae bacterium]